MIELVDAFGRERPPEGYSLIMADPAWHFKTRSKKGDAKSPQAKYRTMTLDEIKAMPVADLAAKDCHLWLWCTNPHIPEALEVMAAWGFTFSTAGHWPKITKNGKLAFGTGYVFRGAGEPYLIGKRGKPKNTRGTRSVIFGQVREHSRKPDEVYAEAERWMPNATRMDLFSRQRREGWHCWGDQADLFEVQSDGAL